MQAIVSALDDPHREMVENIWGELKAVFGLQGVIGSTRPHFTFTSPRRTTPTPLVTRQRSGSATQPFAIETHGLGVFRGDDGAVPARVAIAALMAVHQRWAAVAASAAIRSRCTPPRPGCRTSPWRSAI
jgi:hypothetical protein